LDIEMIGDDLVDPEEDERSPRKEDPIGDVPLEEIAGGWGGGLDIGRAEQGGEIADGGIGWPELETFEILGENVCRVPGSCMKAKQ
jgi:hypothetical protein